MEKAFFHLHRAADADNVYAQNRLGRLYLSEEYKDISKAVDLFLRSMQGDKVCHLAGPPRKGAFCIIFELKA